MRARREQTERIIASLVRREGWFSGEVRVEFLADGEYNENYSLHAGADCFLFRINHGTQLGLDNQIEYEFEVLRAVHPSGVTPEPLRLIPRGPEFPMGAMIMEFVPGVPFNYQRDWRSAAGIFAAIHALPASPSLVRQESPVADIVAECEELLGRHSPHPREQTGRLIREYAREVKALGESEDPRMREEPLCIVNTEVNCTNFIAPPRESATHPPRAGADAGSVRQTAADAAAGVKLVDWEKAVVSYRYQDLGHFLVPTTTLWKSTFQFEPGLRRAFLGEYHKLADPPVSLDELDHRTLVLEKTIVLRALSWTYMAYYEYTQTDRTLKNPDTYERICNYLDDAERLTTWYGDP